MTARPREFRLRRVFAWAFALSATVTVWSLCSGAPPMPANPLDWRLYPLDFLFLFALYQVVCFPAALLIVGPPMTLFAWWQHRRSS